MQLFNNLCPVDIPSNLTVGGIPIAPGFFANSFAEHFSSKVQINIQKTKVKSSVYNGKCQLIVTDRHFMKYDDVKNCFNDLSNKKCEGFDKIPVCALYDSRATLLAPFLLLFDKIYTTCTIPDQWKVAKIVPI